MLTLADRFTVARIFLAPVIIACYLLLPFAVSCWVVAALCGIAELTDWVDGKVARARQEVSDFGKLADPFCDVFYRIAVFMALLLPPLGNPYLAPTPETHHSLIYPLIFTVPHEDPLDGTVMVGAYGLVPWLPVLLMVLRELTVGALRSMSATKGLVLAARASGKLKAWVQGFAIITILGLPAVTGGPAAWQITYNTVIVWLCAALSVFSIVEYMIANRAVLAKLTASRPAPPVD